MLDAWLEGAEGKERRTEIKKKRDKNENEDIFALRLCAPHENMFLAYTISKHLF